MASANDDEELFVEISPKDFRLQQDELLKQAEAIIRNQYVSKVKRMLKGDDFGYDDEMAEETAHAVIDEGEYVFGNAVSEHESDDESEDTCATVNSLGDEYQELFSTSLLCIRAPTHMHRSVKLPREEDDKARKMQYDHFCELHPALDSNAPRSKRVDCTVSTYEEMKTEMDLYFKSCAMRSISSVIVFNGHGGKNGLCIEGRDGKRDTVPLDTMLEDIENLLKTWRKELGLPYRVEVIYAQCYAHLYTEPENCDINVVCFTDNIRKTTPYRIKKDPLTKDVVDSHLPFLEEYAKEEHKNFDAVEKQAELEEKEKEYAAQKMNYGQNGSTPSEPSIGTVMDTSSSSDLFVSTTDFSDANDTIPSESSISPDTDEPPSISGHVEFSLDQVKGEDDQEDNAEECEENLPVQSLNEEAEAVEERGIHVQPTVMDEDVAGDDNVPIHMAIERAARLKDLGDAYKYSVEETIDDFTTEAGVPGHNVHIEDDAVDFSMPCSEDTEVSDQTDERFEMRQDIEHVDEPIEQSENDSSSQKVTGAASSISSSSPGESTSPSHSSNQVNSVVSKSHDNNENLVLEAIEKASREELGEQEKEVEQPSALFQTQGSDNTIAQPDTAQDFSQDLTDDAKNNKRNAQAVDSGDTVTCLPVSNPENTQEGNEPNMDKCDIKNKVDSDKASESSLTTDIANMSVGDT